MVGQAGLHQDPGCGRTDTSGSHQPPGPDQKGQRLLGRREAGCQRCRSMSKNATARARRTRCNTASVPTTTGVSGTTVPGRPSRPGRPPRPPPHRATRPAPRGRRLTPARTSSCGAGRRPRTRPAGSRHTGDTAGPGPRLARAGRGRSARTSSRHSGAPPARRSGRRPAVGPARAVVDADQSAGGPGVAWRRARCAPGGRAPPRRAPSADRRPPVHQLERRPTGPLPRARCARPAHGRCTGQRPAAGSGRPLRRVPPLVAPARRAPRRRGRWARAPPTYASSWASSTTAAGEPRHRAPGAGPAADDDGPPGGGLRPGAAGRAAPACETDPQPLGPTDRRAPARRCSRLGPERQRRPPPPAPDG